MIKLIYILFLLKSLLYIEILTDETRYSYVKMKAVFWIYISYFDNQLAYMKNLVNNPEPLSHRILPPLPFG